MTYAERIIADGASNYWRLNEPSGTSAVDTVGGANGTISGGVTLAQPGALADGDKAMAFNGSTGTIATAVNVSIGSAASFECWLKSTVGQTYPQGMYCGSHSIVAGQDTYMFYLNNGQPGLDFRPASGSNSGHNYNGSGLLDGLWHHVVWVFPSGTLIQIYIDGVQRTLNLNDSATRTQSLSSRFDLGYATPFPGYFNGSLDEVAIYPRALSAGEIRAHYEARTLPFLPGSYPSRVIQLGASNYWRLNDSGATAIDIIGGANGTISGGVTQSQPGATSDGDKAMAFNGTTGKAQTVASVPIPLVCTIEAWIKTTFSGGQQAFFSTRIAGNTGQTVFAGMFGSQAGFYSTGVVTGLVAVNDNKWHHMAMVLNGASVDFYLDGINTATQGQSRTTPSVGPAAIGWDTPDFWNGLIDEVAIYPRALSADEIKTNYTLGIYGMEAEPMPNNTPFNYAYDITPSDTVNLPPVSPHFGFTEALQIGGGGVVAAVKEDNTVTQFTVSAGAILPIRAKRVNASGTTASLIRGLNTI